MCATKRNAPLKKLRAQIVERKAPRTVKRKAEADEARTAGPRLDDEQRAMLLLLLAAGQRESAISAFFEAAGWGKLASSTVSHYRKAHAKQIAEAKAKRIDEAITSGLALKSERIAALKEHADLLSVIRFAPDRHGRLWNERAWRMTLDDIAREMGERRPTPEEAGEQIVKVYVGIDPDRV